MQRFWSLLVQQDIYGHKIGLHYKGRDSYQTKVGSFVTIITYIFIFIFLFKRVTEFIDRSTQVENFRKVKVDLIDDRMHVLDDEEFRFTVSSNLPIKEDIGAWKAYRRYKDPINPLVYYKEELKLRDC